MKYDGSGSSISMKEEKKTTVFQRLAYIVVINDEIFATTSEGIVKVLDKDLGVKAELGYTSDTSGVKCLDGDGRFVAIGHHKGSVTIVDRERPSHKHVRKHSLGVDDL